MKLNNKWMKFDENGRGSRKYSRVKKKLGKPGKKKRSAKMRLSKWAVPGSHSASVVSGATTSWGSRRAQGGGIVKKKEKERKKTNWNKKEDAKKKGIERF